MPRGQEAQTQQKAQCVNVVSGRRKKMLFIVLDLTKTRLVGHGRDTVMKKTKGFSTWSTVVSTHCRSLLIWLLFSSICTPANLITAGLSTHLGLLALVLAHWLSLLAVILYLLYYIKTFPCIAWVTD